MECNEYLADMMGYDTIEEALEDYVGPEHYANIDDREKILEMVKKHGFIENCEIEVTKKDGTPYWANYSMNLDLERQRFECIVIDITKRKKMEEKLKESEKILRNFINSATDHILLFDSELNIIEINELALKALNLERNVAIGMSLIDISPDLKKSGRYSKYMHVIKTGEPLKIEKLVVHSKYGSLSQEVKVFKVGNGLGIISRDITA
jgi:PAS domain S-box-containing protein